MPGTARDRLLREWVGQRLGPDSAGDIQTASSDASFRRYFRVWRGRRSYVVMDAAPPFSDTRVYAEKALAFGRLGLNVPEVLEADFENGFLLLTDLGSRTYLQALGFDTVERLYGDALGALVVLQACGLPLEGALPPYDRDLLLREMALFSEWLVARLLGMHFGEYERDVLREAFTRLTEQALLQPQVSVHRDFHSRNLMVAGRNNPGILDFQDAVSGPVTYDLVSLLRDCYISWPQEKVTDWAKGYHHLALQSGILREEDEQQFLHWFDWMGVQRHLKAAGIFARLHLRDGKSGYLKDIPRTVHYIFDVSQRYAELADLGRLLKTRVMPLLGA